MHSFLLIHHTDATTDIRKADIRFIRHYNRINTQKLKKRSILNTTVSPDKRKSYDFPALEFFFKIQGLFLLIFVKLVNMVLVLFSFSWVTN